MQGRILLPFLGLGLLGALVSAYFLWQNNARTYRLVLASGSKTGEYYAFSQAFAEVVARNHPNLAIEVIETNGSPENMALLQTNQAHIALVQSDTPVEAPVRAVALLFPEMFHLIVRTDAEIESVADLAGKRVALMPQGSGSYALFWPLIEHYGLTPGAIATQPMPATAAHEALRQGQVDALFRVITLGNDAVRDLLQDPAVQLLAIDQFEALRLSLPYLYPHTIPRGTYNGGRPIPPEDVPVVAVNALLVAHERLPNRVVNALTRTLYENRNELVARYPRAAMIRLDISGTDLGLPLHPGAEAFYRQNEPEFLVKYAEPIGLLLSVAVLGISSLWQARLWLTQKQKNRADTYNLEILDLIDRIDQAQSIPALMELRQELFTILKQVVIDLDVDRITTESFESFTFPWEIALNSLRHQEILLRDRTTDSTLATALREDEESAR